MVNNSGNEFEQIINKALEMAKSKEYEFIREDFLSCIVMALAVSGRVEEALRMVGDIDKHFNTVRDISRILAEAGKLNEALEIAKKMKSESERATIIGDIATALATRGKINEAIEILKNEVDNPWRSFAIKDVIRYLILANKLDEALEIAKIHENEFLRAIEQLHIARELARRGRRKEAYRLINETIEMARNTKDSFSRIRILCNVAETLAEIGDRDETYGLISEALKITKSIENRDERSSALETIATCILKIGKVIELPVLSERDIPEEILKVLIMLLEIAMNVDDDLGRTVLIKDFIWRTRLSFLSEMSRRINKKDTV